MPRAFGSRSMIPFAQTRAYVQRVEHAQVEYRSEYGL